MNDAICETVARGVTLRLSAANPRLRLWAERFEEIEPEFLDYIDALPEGVVFYDAGASIGHFALYAAIKRGAQVYAFEPEAQNFGTLELNHHLNRASLRQPFSSFNVALSDQRGVGKLFTRVYGAGEHVKILDTPETRDTHEHFDPQHVQTILTLTLDELVDGFGLPVPAAMKIDVDGAEIPLLHGARRVLEDPTLRSVFIELAQDAATETGLLEGAGFALTRRDPVVRMSGGFYEGLYNCVFSR
jgi:FkbM family methyltransferase